MMESDSSSSDEERAAAAEREALEAMTVLNNNMAGIIAAAPTPSSVASVDHRTLRRKEKKQYQYEDAMYCINRDYLGPEALFDGKRFDRMFRISKDRFRRLMKDLAASGDPFYKPNPKDAFDKKGISMEARLLLPLKSMAYGVSSHTFMDYFQMSETQARTCYYKFQEVVTKDLCSSSCAAHLQC